MIINQDKGLSVPKKTIVFFPVVPDDGIRSFDLKDINLFLTLLSYKKSMKQQECVNSTIRLTNNLIKIKVIGAN